MKFGAVNPGVGLMQRISMLNNGTDKSQTVGNLNENNGNEQRKLKSLTSY